MSLRMSIKDSACGVRGWTAGMADSGEVGGEES